MKILKYNYLIRANVEHVYLCHIDLDFVSSVFREVDDFRNVQIVKEDNELLLKKRDAQLHLKVLDSTENSYLKIEVTPNLKSIEWLGSAIIDCMFSEEGPYTRVNIEITSDKNPGFLVKMFIKAYARIIRFQSRKFEKTYAQAIEQSA